MKKKLLIFGLAGAMLLGMGIPSYSEAKVRTCTFRDKNHDGYCDRCHHKKTYKNHHSNNKKHHSSSHHSGSHHH